MEVHADLHPLGLSDGVDGRREGVAQALHRIGKFYVFLREVRAELFDEAFQAELAAIYQPVGRCRCRQHYWRW